MTTYFAEELTAPEFAAFVNGETVGILPIAAIEPHGPHLPLSTDCDIARGHLAHVADVVAEETSVLILPLQTIGLFARAHRLARRLHPSRRRAASAPGPMSPRPSTPRADGG